MKYFRTILFSFLILVVSGIVLIAIWGIDQARRFQLQIHSSLLQTSNNGIQHIVLEFHPILIYPWLLYTKQHGLLSAWVLLGAIRQSDGKQLVLPLLLEIHPFLRSTFSIHALFHERVSGSLSEGGVVTQPQAFSVQEAQQKLKQTPVLMADIPLTKIPEETVKACGIKCEVLNTLIPPSTTRWNFSVLPVLFYADATYE
jgi:hypothetical protein